MFIMLCGSNAYAFSYADVVAEAERLARSAYVEDTTPLPQELLDMDYDDYRSIRYQREKGPCLRS